MTEKGRIHSWETCETVDGPGIRFVLFMQGCPLRCLYCHNPDTWEISEGQEYTVEEIFKRILRNEPYFQASGGGVTVSGGEPGLQAQFVAELFKECKQHGIHTALDTSGSVGLKKILPILDWTDLVILDLKHGNPEKHRLLTGKTNEKIIEVAEYLNQSSIKFWLRHVLVPGYTDRKDDLEQLVLLLNKLERAEKLELIPYHKLGLHKWAALGLTNRLASVSPPSITKMEEVKNFLRSRTKLKIC